MAEGNVERITVCYCADCSELNFTFFFMQKHFFLILLVFQGFNKLLLANILANAGDKIFDKGFDSCMSEGLSQNEMCLNGT